jgi:hypothetical protein
VDIASSTFGHLFIYLELLYTFEKNAREKGGMGMIMVIQLPNHDFQGL